MLKKVHKIEIRAKKLSNDVFSGQFKSAFKGRGMTFSEVRDYSYGDDVRNIDWNVSARFNHPYVKIFEEERELTIMLMIDISGSACFGSKGELKSEMMAEIAATIAFSAISNNDKVGAVLFSNKVEKYIPPKKGSSHCLRIIRELLSYRKQDSPTSFSAPFDFVNNVIRKKCTCFFITDGFGDFGKGFTIFSHKHDVCSIIINDTMEQTLPDLGLVAMKDSESGKSLWVDTSNKKLRDDFAKFNIERRKNIENVFKKLGVDYIIIATDEDYIKALIKLFAKRGKL